MEIETKNSALSVCSVALLIAGCTIGAGILGLPIQTGLAGALPSLIGICTAWLFMYISGLVIIERFIQAEDNSINLPTIFQRAFGRTGKYVATLGYLINYYGVMVAYLSASSSVLAYLVPLNIPQWGFLLIFFIPSTIITLVGLKYAMRANNFFMLVLGVSFAVLLFFTFKNSAPQRLLRTDWPLLPGAMPLILTAFVYHNIIPSFCVKLKNDHKSIRKALLIGTLIPLGINLLWTFAVIGALPLDGETGSIVSAFQKNQPATVPLSECLKSEYITGAGMIFSLAAIFTSYVSIAHGLGKFFKDLTSGIKRDGGKIGNIFLTFGPPLVVALIYPDFFLKALDIAGGVGVVLIFGILPSLMLINSRKKTAVKTATGIALLIIFLIFMGLEIGQELGLFNIKASTENWKLIQK